MTKRDSYHHGDLKAALIATSIELIEERGLRDFSLAAASRRLGVAVSAPYAHFADRDELLAAISVHGLELFRARLEPKLARATGPEERLAAIGRTYVRFAAQHRPLFETLFDAGLDKRRFPEIVAAERRIDDDFTASLREVIGDDEAAIESVAAAIEATVHGHATLLLDGRFGEGRRAVQRAADSAAQATLALIDSRRLLLPPSRSGLKSRSARDQKITRSSGPRD